MSEQATSVKTQADLLRLMAEVSKQLGKAKAKLIIEDILADPFAPGLRVRGTGELEPNEIAAAYEKLQEARTAELAKVPTNVVAFPNAAAPTQAEPPDNDDDDLADGVELSEKDRNRQLLPLDVVTQYDDQDVKGIADICNRWVWITGLKLWVRRADTTKQWDKEQFDSEYNRFVQAASMTKALHKGSRIQRFDRAVFRPNKPEFIGRDYNTWRASPIIAERGDTALWDQHLAYLIPDESDRNKVLDWLAGVVQRQGVKPMHALFLWGKVPGTGKSFIFEALKLLLGELNCQTLTQDVLASGFTGWAMRTKLVVVEEIRNLATKEIKHMIHPWITQKDITVHDKHIRSAKMDNVIAFGFMSNKGDYPLDNGDRRYLVVQSPAEVHPNGVAYYRPLYRLLTEPAALAAIKWQLENRKLAPGYSIEGNAPFTAAKTDMMEAGRSDLETWLREHPPTAELVTLDDVIADLPNGLRRNGLYNTAREFVKDICDGVPLGEHRLKGRDGPRVSLWAVNANELPPSQWAARVKELTALDRKWRARRYLKQADSASAAEAQEEFGS